MELRYSWTKAVTIDDYSPLFATIRTIRILFAIRHYSLFAIRYSRLFAIRYSGFSDTRFWYKGLTDVGNRATFRLTGS